MSIIPAIGQYAKVWLPGETPWAECVAIEADGTWHGRIANRLFAERGDKERGAIAEEFFTGTGLEPLPSLHSYKQDQVVRWEWRDDGHGARWMPAERAGGSA